VGKIRLLLLLITFVIVGAIGTLVFSYARGYRLNPGSLTLSPNGLLVIKSVPDGAQIFINGELKNATNSTMTLSPGTYDVSVRKEGYHEWQKRLTVEKEVVTEATAHLFKIAPSLSAITFSGIVNPVPSRDFTKISFVIPPTKNQNSNETNEGLWITEIVNLPLGFSREPRRITDGDLTKASWIWSTDGRKILLTTEKGIFLLDTSTFTTQAQRVNISAQKQEILKEWEQDQKLRESAQIKKLPDDVEDLLRRKTKSMLFSPDEEMVVYIASGSATLAPNLISQLPGSSTQKQERDIKPNQTYLYDIKEDRNFLIDEDGNSLIIEGGFPSEKIQRRISWYSTSRHIILAEPNQITIMDYDGTNRQIVYSGNYVSPHAFPTLSLDRLLILTNLGADSAPPNLYSLSIK